MSDFTEDCKNCYNWLLRSGVITAEVCSITDLYELGCLLKDGVILCQLSNHLSPFSIDANEYSHRSQMPQFLCLKNIRLFLHACRLTFNLKEDDLFEAMDLYEMKDLPKVLNTLSQLSQSDHNNKQLQPFYVKNQSSIYDFKSLHNHHNDQSKNTKTSHDRHEGDVYGRLVDFQPVNAPRDPQPMLKRELCIRELAVTEHNFIDALKMIKQYFMDPLEALLKPQDFQTIFSYVELLTKVHTGFYSDLVKACINCNIDYNINNNNTANNVNNNLINTDMDIHFDLSIPDCFIKHKESFLIYGSFCSNLVKAQNLLDDLCAADPAIHKQVEKSQLEANEGRFKLRDLLAVPMQRVLKYHLFLKELIKNTGVSHKDRKSLERALEEIQDLSLYVNEVKRDNDALLLLDEISRSIIGYEMPENMSLKDYGRLINDGEVKLKAHSDHKNKSRYAFLFDKVLLFCKLKGESFYSFKSALIVTSFKIEDVNAKEKNFGYTFVLGERNMTNTYTIGCRTLELKNKWIDAIRTAQDNVSPEHSHNYLHSFEMASFQQTTICDICRKLLKGLFYQGYLCQKTNMVVHKECIEKARDLPGPPKPPPKSTNKLKFSYSDRGSSSSLSPMLKTPNKFSHSTDHPFFNKPNGMSKSPFQTHSSLDALSNLSNYSWYVGSMSRDDATTKLEGCADGSFLVRASLSDQRRGEYALSIKYGNEIAVKHIKIQRNFEGLFFIADCKIFKSIPDLVGYYERNSLQPSFSEVPTTLLYPYKKAFKMPTSTRRQSSQEQSSVLSYCIAMFDYPASEPNQLELKAGEKVAVLSKQAAGWWKGALNGQIGYFPSSFVKEAEDEKNLIKFNQPLL